MTREIFVPLVGPDGDPERVSEQALPFARALARRLDANLVLASVVDSPDEMEARKAYLDSVLLKCDPKQRRLTVVVEGEPAAGIIELAWNRENSIIVMASHSRTGLKRMLLGSVALQVVLGTDRPVMVVPATDAGTVGDDLPTLRRVLIPLDDSFMAETVLQAAINALGGEDLALHLIDVIEPLSTRAGFMEGEYQSTVRQATTHYLSRVSEQMRESGFETEWEIRVGDPALEVATVSDETQADVIVMATHGRKGLGRFIFGSVGERLAEGRQTPILMIHPDEEAIEQARQAAGIVRTSALE